MRLARPRTLLALSLTATLAFGCGADTQDPAGTPDAAAGGTGGATPTLGGSAGSGATALGGSAGSGATAPTTGGVATGAATGSGGANSAGGAVSTGGATGSGGVAELGGAATGGAPAAGSPSASGGATETGGTSSAAGAPPTTGGAPSEGGGPASGGAEPSGGAGGATGDGGATGTGGTVSTADCQALLTDPSINWRESALQTDAEIVECLATSLGTPVGYGERTTGGYDPAGSSRLVVITRGDAVSVEQQLLDAISTEDFKWIVFDKRDFADPYAVAMYRTFCDDSALLTAIGASSADSCRDASLWCAEHGVAAGDCVEQFFNVTLNDGDLPIRVNQLHSNTTIDGRGSQAYFLFSGFKIGADSDSQPTHTDSNVIVTHLLFQGAGHVEDHALDPDMIRSTGGSHDIWIHQNTFDLTGDSAWDVKVGAHDITMSSNLVRNVQRTCLHASKDSETVSTAITTTMHGNAFVTTDDYYELFGQGGRRVPLIRLGQSHMFNNVFFNYRRQVVSVRVGARLSMDRNLFLVDTTSAASRDDDLPYFVENLLTGFESDGGGLEVTNSFVGLADGACNLDPSELADLSASYGSTPDMLADYGAASRATIEANRFDPGPELADYVFATAGKDGADPFNSPYTLGRAGVLALGHRNCQE